MLDGNAAMLNAAEVKMKAAFDDSIVDQVVEAKLPSMPFEDKRFDAVLFSLVRIVFMGTLHVFRD